MTTKKSFSSYTFGEGRTGIEQLVKFTCRTVDDVEKIKAFLHEHVRDIDIPTTDRINVPHGGYGRYTRYNVTQHDYAGGGGGYIEVLEIKNPPDGRCGIVIFDSCRGEHGGCFTEWETVEHARNAFQQVWGRTRHTEELYKSLAGFKRFVSCNAITPWFYAIGDEALIGDYAFPQGLQDDPVYRLGRKFIVFNHEDVPLMKTCMGSRLLEEADHYSSHKKKAYRRYVYFDDGSVWREPGELGGRHRMPIPADEGELWIAEAVQQFQKLLAGNSTEFTINFTDGDKFVGKVTRTSHKNPCAAGDYRFAIKVVGEEKPREGWINDFSPTPEAPDPIQLARIKFAEKGKELEYAEIKEVKTKQGGKKWSGVFYRRTL